MNGDRINTKVRAYCGLQKGKSKKCWDLLRRATGWLKDLSKSNPDGIYPHSRPSTSSFQCMPA